MDMEMGGLMGASLFVTTVVFGAVVIITSRVRADKVLPMCRVRAKS
jgi:hypothetical protein